MYIRCSCILEKPGCTDVGLELLSSVLLPALKVHTGLRQFLATASPWKMLFILPQKFFLFSRYLSFCLDVLVMYQNGLIKKIIFPNILRSKVNQTMKFDKLIECNMTNIFLEKSYTNCDGGTSPRLFPEKLKLSISLDQ